MMTLALDDAGLRVDRATKTLREFIPKSFVLDDERLKQVGKDYFDELLERKTEGGAHIGCRSEVA